MSFPRIPDVLRTNWNGWCHLALACALLMGFAVARLHAQTFQDLYDFNCITGGCNPIDLGQLTQGTDGNLYGTTRYGGSHNSGTIFKVTPSAPAVRTDLLQFDGANGAEPFGGLTLASDGNFYGTTVVGGTLSRGTLFRFTPPTTLTVLHNFNGTTDGRLPESPPVEAKDGNLYGVTGSLTTGFSGPTYRVTLSTGTFKQLPTSAPGGMCAPLLLASDGNLYGTTFNGGTSGIGTVFRMTTGDAFKILHSFSVTDGETPSCSSLTQGSDSNLYGTTLSVPDNTNNSGEVFRLTLSGTFKVLHKFDALTIPGGTNNDGGNPTGLLAVTGGNFYGAASVGGASGNGTLFRITKTGIFNKLVDFTGKAGAAPGADAGATLMEHTNGSFYGLTVYGGSTGNGTFYSLTPPSPIPILVMEGPIFVLPGVPVRILGDNLNEVISVRFGGVQAQFRVGSETYLVAQVPSGAVDGFITAILETGQQIESETAVHILPVIANLDPTSGPVGTQVGIVGGGFVGTTKVTFGGVKAANFRVASPTLIQAFVPTGAKTGKVSVATANGTATSKATFTVN